MFFLLRASQKKFGRFAFGLKYTTKNKTAQAKKEWPIFARKIFGCRLIL